MIQCYAQACNEEAFHLIRIPKYFGGRDRDSGIEMFLNQAYCKKHFNIKLKTRGFKYEVWKGHLFKEVLGGHTCQNPLCTYSATEFSKVGFLPPIRLYQYCQFHAFGEMRNLMKIPREEFDIEYIKSITES
jgi:hypothetical protein